MEHAPRAREAEVQARWAGGATGAWNSTPRAASAKLVYEGRGGGTGFSRCRPPAQRLAADLWRCGDLVRAGSWRAHGRGRDPRYDGVVLHVVLTPSRERETALASALSASIVTLGTCQLTRDRGAAAWPCVGLAARMARRRCTRCC